LKVDICLICIMLGFVFITLLFQYNTTYKGLKVYFHIETETNMYNVLLLFFLTSIKYFLLGFNNILIYRLVRYPCM